MNERHISGIVRTRQIAGTALQHASIGGGVRIAGKTVKELVFGSLSTFPNPGSEEILYIDTDSMGFYCWTEGSGYMALANEIDDQVVEASKTWSSSKINENFQDQSNRIDNIGNFAPMSNQEILEILMG